MNALEIVAVSVGGYGSGWAASTWLFLKNHAYTSGPEHYDYVSGVVGYTMLSAIGWPLTLIPQVVYAMIHPERVRKGGKKAARLSRAERKRAKKIEEKRRELEAARQVKELQDEIDRIALT